jgi:hypothetical protein
MKLINNINEEFCRYNVLSHSIARVKLYTIYIIIQYTIWYNNNIIYIYIIYAIYNINDFGLNDFVEPLILKYQNSRPTFKPTAVTLKMLFFFIFLWLLDQSGFFTKTESVKYELPMSASAAFFEWSKHLCVHLMELDTLLKTILLQHRIQQPWNNSYKSIFYIRRKNLQKFNNIIFLILPR